MLGVPQGGVPERGVPQGGVPERGVPLGVVNEGCGTMRRVLRAFFGRIVRE